MPTKLHNEMNLTIVLEEFEYPDNMRMIQLRDNPNFILELIAWNRRVSFKYGLTHPLLAGGNMNDPVYYPEGTLPDD
jgi:hypothetical protein